MSRRQSHPRHVNLRRAFASDRLRKVYQRAVDLGWLAKVHGDGHVAMYSPDGSTHITLSTTASDNGRVAQNSEARLKRWQKERTA